MEPLDALARATTYYEQRLMSITPPQWDQDSICEAWTVRDVADHVLGGNRFAIALLAGQRADDALGHALALGFDGDPVTLYRASAGDQLDAFAAPGALDRVVHHPAGEIDGRQFLGLRLGDLVLHGWDLACSTGGDDSLDEELVAPVWEAYQPILGAAGEHRAFGEGPTGNVPPNAPLALRLLDLTGRRP